QGGLPIETTDVEAALPSRLALVPPGPIAQEFARVLAGLRVPPSGTIRIGDHDLSTLPRAVRSRRIAFADLEPVLFLGTVRDNLLYGLRIQPLRTRGIDLSKARINEAVKTGNPADSIDDPWIDYARFGVRDARELD
ncbi:ABC transporter ATP-binding protein, partial [Corallococcus exercitus]|nr:ABC transporter ATP-binding protein [Corallococcus exercitus]